ncbi:MAG: type 1 glutamine amidotransferase [Rubrobacter sp.]|jgi:GMP synthase-like glutamine amidotransferase|nr:type 1 glutamine amidotransferase [Rubrobacter sp.]
MNKPGNETKPALVRQHEERTPPGLLEEWMRERGIPFEVSHSKAGGLLPKPEEYSFVASLGSPHGPNDAHVEAVRDELALVEKAVEKDVPVLGLCFGGEVLSAVLGGVVEKADVPEVGWRKIHTDDPDAVPPGPWLVWHYERFTTPPGAVEVARTKDATHAFRAGPHLGVQFHPESTVEIVAKWADADTERLGKLGIHDPEEILSATPEEKEKARSNAFRFFDAFFENAMNSSVGKGVGEADGKE